MNNKRLLIPSAGALALALACAGCGSTNQATSTSSTTAADLGATTTTVTAPTTARQTTTTKQATTTTANDGPSGGPVPANFDPVSFSGISGSQFWLLGDAPCSNPVCTSVIRTTNGGKTFVGIPAPRAPLALNGATTPTPGVDTLDFADAQDGYAYSTGQDGELWDTHDGGAQWSQPAGLTGKELLAFAVGGGYAFALTGTCSGGSCSAMTLEHSPVGSDGWSGQALPVPSGSDPVATMAVYGTDVWASVTSPADQANQVLVSGSGVSGSLTASKSPCTSGLAGTLEASSPDVVWAVCPTGMLAQAFRSDDGGADWSTLKTGEIPNDTQLAPSSATDAVLVPTEAGPLIGTTDGGQTWQDISGTATSGNYGWYWLGFTNSKDGAALQVNGTPPSGWPWPDGPFPEQLWQTSDGGKTWSGPVQL